MSRDASGAVEDYLARLRSELAVAGTADTDDLVTEIRSLLEEASAGDADAEAEIARLGEPAELARSILAERGLDAAAGVAPGLWWRLGLAAPIDIAIGLALPLAAAAPLYAIAAAGEPRAAGIAMAVALGVATLAWPFFVWRPWRAGGRALSPGMALTSLAVVRAPGSWRLVRVRELEAMGLAPKRRLAGAVVSALVAVTLLAGVAVIGLDFGGSWLAEAAISAEFDGKTIGGGNTLDMQLGSVTRQVYIGLMDAEDPWMTTAAPYLTPEVDPQALWERIGRERIREVRIGTPEQIRPGVYRFEVQEFADGAISPVRVGSSTFTVGWRQWLRAKGEGGDWAVVAIEAGAARESD